MADPKVIQMIQKAATKYGADPVAMLATALTEDGARLGVKGDFVNGKATSYGAFQFHEGGALPKGVAPAWADSQAAFDNRAKEFARLQVKGGKGAAAIQRPADPTEYAAKVQANLGKASQMLKLPSGKDSSVPVSTPPAQIAQAAPPQAGQVTPFGLTPGDLLASAKRNLGQTQATSGVSYIEQALGASKQPTEPGAPLPSGGFSSVPVNKLKMDKGVESTALSPSGKGIVQAALKFKGTPYSWGGGGVNGPSKGIAQGAKTVGFDCSGLLQYSVYHATGEKIPRVAQAQYAAAKPVSLANAKPGAAVFFGTKDNVHHVGIYLGDGKFIEAPHTGDVVKVSSLAGRKDVVGLGTF